MRMLLTIIGLCMVFLAACGSQSISEPMVLKSQDGEEVTFPASKPVVLFFITTYT